MSGGSCLHMCKIPHFFCELTQSWLSFLCIHHRKLIGDLVGYFTLPWHLHVYFGLAMHEPNQSTEALKVYIISVSGQSWCDWPSVKINAIIIYARHLGARWMCWLVTYCRPTKSLWRSWATSTVTTRTTCWLQWSRRLSKTTKRHACTIVQHTFTKPCTHQTFPKAGEFKLFIALKPVKFWQ